MKPYNICGCEINKWVDLDSVLEIDYPEYGSMRYRLAFTDDYVYVNFREPYWYSFERECYRPFLEAWKNKDLK